MNKFASVFLISCGLILGYSNASCGSRRPLVRRPIPPDAPRVFTATQDIPPPYKVTTRIVGDSIFAYINGVFVQKMVLPPRDVHHIQESAAMHRKVLERCLEPGGILLILQRGGMLSIPLYEYDSFIEELARARKGVAGPYRLLLRPMAGEVFQEAHSR